MTFAPMDSGDYYEQEGRAANRPQWDPCPDCDGDGTLGGEVGFEEICDTCHGTGRMCEEGCVTCEEEGR